MASSALIWEMVKRNNCYLLKNSGKCFTREPNNLTGRNTFVHSGLAQKQTVGIVADKSGKGVHLVTKKPKSVGRPAKAYNKVSLTRGNRRAMTTIKKTLKQGKYRPGLCKAALKRASAVLRSQKPVGAEIRK